MSENNEKKIQTEEIIGRASATEREPNSAEKFSFWIRPGVRLNPFDIS